MKRFFWRSVMESNRSDLYFFSNGLKAKYSTKGIDVMKRRSGMRLVVLMGLAALTVQQAKAGSAVASDGNGHLSISFGHSKEVDKQSALELGRRLHGPNVRIVAASDVAGYCAIATARTGAGWISGVALGRATREEAVRLAIEQCLKFGGANPKINQNFEDELGQGAMEKDS